MVFQIFAAAGYGYAGLVHIDGGFRRHGQQCEDGQQLQAEIPFLIIIEENPI